MTGLPLTATGVPLTPTGVALTATGRSLTPAGRALTPTGRVLTPTGSLLTPTGRTLTPTGRALTGGGPGAAFHGRLSGRDPTRAALGPSRQRLPNPGQQAWPDGRPGSAGHRRAAPPRSGGTGAIGRTDNHGDEEEARSGHGESVGASIISGRPGFCFGVGLRSIGRAGRARARAAPGLTRALTGRRVTPRSPMAARGGLHRGPICAQLSRRRIAPAGLPVT